MTNTISKLRTNNVLVKANSLNPRMFKPVVSNLKMYCNTYLVSLKQIESGKIVTKYYVLNSDIATLNEITIKEASNYITEFKASCTKLCSAIPKSFINTSINKSDMVIYQFSHEEIIPRASRASTSASRARTSKLNSKPNVGDTFTKSRLSVLNTTLSSKVPKKPTDVEKKFKPSLCGFVCLKNLANDKWDDDSIRTNIYLDLICSQPGTGSNLLNTAEEVSRSFHKNCLYLKSIYAPLPFYLYKKYVFVDGDNSVDLNLWFDENIKSGKPIEFHTDPFCQLIKIKGQEIKTTRSGRKSKPGPITNIQDCNYLRSVQGDLVDGILYNKLLINQKGVKVNQLGQ